MLHQMPILGSLGSAVELNGELNFPVAGDRSYWESLDKDLREVILTQGEAAQKEKWTVLLASDYLEFSRSGDRVRFENRYFPRRTKLAQLTIAECIEGKGRFLDDIIDGLYLILEESSWCLPPHNSYGKDADKLSLPSVKRPVVDLFAAETAALVGLVEYLLRNELKKISPFIGENVNAAITERIVNPCLNEYFWWMGFREVHVNNWTAWISQNVLLALYSRAHGVIPDPQKERLTLLIAAALDHFLDDYGEDGCCNEGVHYYHRAGLCLYGALEILNRVSSGAMREVFQLPKLRNIAAYIMKMHVSGEYYINYADSSANAGHRNAEEYAFAKATDNECMMQFVAEDYQKQEWGDRILSQTEAWGLYERLFQVEFHYEMMKKRTGTRKQEDTWFPSTGLMIARDDAFVLAAKAGNNGESHNHNDVGSVIVYKGGRPFLIDVGVETYCEKTFSKKRYEIWTMQSAYHNLPSFYEDGSEKKWIQQTDGEKYRAVDVSVTQNSDISVLQMDIARAYADPRIKSYCREVKLEKNRGIFITDRWDCDLNVVLSFMFYETPRLYQDDVSGEWDIQVGNLGILHACGIKSAQAEVCTIQDPRLQQAWKHDCYRVLLYADKKSTRIEMLE